MSEQVSMDEKLLAEVAGKLLDKFDTVQIFASRYEQQNTVSVSHGNGNYFTRYGQVREWIICNEELMRRKEME